MKLLVVNWQDRLNPLAGGAEIHLHEVFGRLAAAGHEVTLLASGWPGAAPREAIDGLQVHRVGGRHTFSVQAPRYFRRVLHPQRFDAVVEDLNKVPVFTPRWAKTRVVLLVHHLFGWTAFREATAPVAAATVLLERTLPAFYRGLPVQAVSHSTASDLVNRGLRRKDITVIPNGVDLHFFTPGAGTERFTAPTFVYVGRLRRYKAADLQIRAVARLRQRGTSVRLAIAGRGNEEAALRRLAARLGVNDLVRFLGYITEDEKRDWMRRAWANLYTSPKEGWGISNVEAAACGTPSIASDSPGLRESVVDGRTGLLVPHGDVEALADAMARLANDPARVGALGAGARRFAERFSWDHAAAQTERHLHAVLGRKDHLLPALPEEALTR